MANTAQQKAAVTESPKARPKTYKVRAIKEGYHNDRFYRPGDVFTIPGDLPRPDQIKRKAGPDRDPNVPILFSEKWMEFVPASTPEKISGPNDAIRKHHDEVSAARSGSAKPIAEDDPLAEPEA